MKNKNKLLDNMRFMDFIMSEIEIYKNVFGENNKNRVDDASEELYKILLEEGFLNEKAKSLLLKIYRHKTYNNSYTILIREHWEGYITYRNTFWLDESDIKKWRNYHANGKDFD